MVLVDHVDNKSLLLSVVAGKRAVEAARPEWNQGDRFWIKLLRA